MRTIIYVDSEGEPIQEFSALYVDHETFEILDVFHRYVRYPLKDVDYDIWARKHVHGLNLKFLNANGLKNESDLLFAFQQWLKAHPFEYIFAHAPFKERQFLNLPIQDVCLPPWLERTDCLSHELALSMKRNAVPICNVTCDAHKSFVNWCPKRPYVLTPTDVIKKNFGHHCSLYDCVELYFHHSQ